MTRLRGAFTALVTPFKGDELDEKALRDIVERQIAEGIDGLVPCGTTGESVTLRGDEAERVVKITVEQAKGRVPVVAGAGTNSTYKSIQMAKTVRDTGADALLLVCPYYNKPTQAGLEAHFRAILKEVPMPAMLYNIPGRTGSDLQTETLERLADVEHVVAIKEATGNVLRAQQILARCGDRFDVMSGDDALTAGMMGVGGHGVVSVSANLVPGKVAGVVDLWNAGKVAEAQQAQHTLLPLHEAMFVETNPGPIKAAMAMAGHIAEEIRLPMVWPSAESQKVIRAAMQKVGAS